MFGTLKNLSIRTNILGATVGALVIVVITGLVGTIAVTGLNEAVERFTQRVNPKVEAVVAVERRVVAAAAATEAFILDPQEELKARADKDIRAIAEALDSAARAAEADEDKTLAADIETTRGQVASLSEKAAQAFGLIARDAELQQETLALGNKVLFEAQKYPKAVMDALNNAAMMDDLDALFDLNSEMAVMLEVDRQAAHLRRLESAYLVSRKEEDRLSLDAKVKEYVNLLGRLENSIDDAARTKMIEDTAKALAEYQALLDQLVANNEQLQATKQELTALASQAVDNMKAAVAKVTQGAALYGQASVEEGHANLLIMGAVILAAIILMIGLGFVNANVLSTPVQKMTRTMTRLAEGDLEAEIPATEYKNEIGDMAKAVEVFKRNGREQADMRAKEARQIEEREARQKKLEDLTNRFDAAVTGVLSTVTGAIGQMNEASTAMSQNAKTTMERSSTVSTATQEASGNVQTVVAATTELSASIQEISRQINHAASAAQDAVRTASSTNDKIESLAVKAQSIGEVVSLINDIAEQTNLLALNATIEAARAGDAGKGFAVVANEVKSLANQTAQATEQITRQISGIQSETDGSVMAIREIVAGVRGIEELTTTIAAAVEQQDAATSEISRNIEEAAMGTDNVASNIRDVASAAEETGSMASNIQSDSDNLKRESERLRGEVESFLGNVRGL
ncbi:methyl-accepting chemotaxis protein [Aestuariispira insulae]|uniref:methyl-accepting chemotaxis protein n=1 Tax=Aestuariispira insulae TaxID=1461337 RepID=UPI0015F2934A|nr:methyl-accepting chemotaxis protein [Aestuariispira insulae]